MFWDFFFFLVFYNQTKRITKMGDLQFSFACLCFIFSFFLYNFKTSSNETEKS